MAQQWRICLWCRRCGFDSWVGKIPWRRAWQPTPVFLPGEPQVQRSLAGYSPWGCKRVRRNLATKPPPPVYNVHPKGKKQTNRSWMCFLRSQSSGPAQQLVELQPPLPTSCVTLGKLLNFPVPWLPRLLVVTTVPVSQGYCMNNWIHTEVSVLCAHTKPYLISGCFVERAQEGLAIIKYMK